MRKITVNVEGPEGTSAVEFVGSPGLMLKPDGELTTTDDNWVTDHVFPAGSWSSLRVTEESGL